MRRLLVVLALLALAAAGGLYLAGQHLARQVANGAIEAAIVDAVREHLGLEVELGALHVATFPTLSVEKVRVRGVADDVLRLGALRIRLDVSDYLSGKVVIDEVRLVAPEIHLVRDEAGQLNVKDLVARIKEHQRKRLLAARSEQKKQLDAVLREMHELEEDLPPLPPKKKPGGERPQPTPEPPEPEVEPAPPPPPHPPPPRVMNQGPVVLRRVAIAGGRVTFRDHTVGLDPFRADLDGLDVEVVLPLAMGEPIDATLETRVLGAPLRVEARVDPINRSGPVAWRLEGLPLGAVQPYLEKRLEVPVSLGRIPLHIEGKLVLDGPGEPKDFQVDVAIPDSKLRVRRGDQEITATLGLDAQVRPDKVELRGLRVDLAEALGLEFSATVVDRDDPDVTARLRLTRFDMPALLALLPAEKAERLAKLEPRFDLGLDAILEGKVKAREFHPDVALEIGPASARLDLGGAEPLDLELAKTWLRVDDEAVTVSGLELHAGGVKVLEGSLKAEGWRRLPRLEAHLAVPDVRLGEVLEELPPALPPKPGRDEALAKLRDTEPGGSVGLTVGVTVDTAHVGEVEGFHHVATLKDLLQTLKDDPAAKARLRDPATVAQLLQQGAVDLGVDLAVKDLRATVRKDDLEVPVAAEAAVHLGLDGLRLRRVRAGALGVQLEARGEVAPGAAPASDEAAPPALELPALREKIEARLAALPPELQEPVRDLLERTRANLSLHLGGEGGGPLDVAGVLEKLPPARRDAAARLKPEGKLELAVGLQGTAFAPSPFVRLGVEGLAAEVPTRGDGPARVALPELSVEADAEGVRIPPAELRTPMGAIALAATASDPLGEKALRLRLATPGKGLDLTKAIPLLPEETRAKLEGAALDKADLDLRVDLTGTVEDPGAKARVTLTLPTSQLRVGADLEHLRSSKDLKAFVETGEGGIPIQKLLDKLPADRRLALEEKLRMPVPGAIHLEARVDGSLARKETLGVRAQVGLGLPGGDLRLRARVDDPTGTRKLAASLEGQLSRIREILDVLPEAKAARLKDMGLAAELRISAKASGTKDAIDGSAQVGLENLSMVLAPAPDERMPVQVEPFKIDARFHVEPRPGRPPVVEVGASAALDALVSHPKHGPIPASLRVEDVRYDGDSVSLGSLALEAMGQPLRVSGRVTDLRGRKHLDLDASLGLDVRHLVSRLVPPEAEIRSNGNLKVTADVGGTAARPEWDVRIALEDLFLDAYKLKGIPVKIDGLELRATTDDLIVAPFRLSMGGNTNEFFLTGSMKERIGAENFWTAFREDRDAVLERLAAVFREKGGKAAVVKMVGNETLLRLLGSSRHKIIIHVQAPDLDRPVTFKTLMEPDESAEFDYRREEILEKYRVLALEQAYGRMGATERMFGKSRRQVFPVANLTEVVLDKHFNMVWPRQVPFWRLVTTPGDF